MTMKSRGLNHSHSRSSLNRSLSRRGKGVHDTRPYADSCGGWECGREDACRIDNYNTRTAAQILRYDTDAEKARCSTRMYTHT